MDINRSIPKIGRHLGNSEDLIFPEIDVMGNLAEDSKIAIITIKVLAGIMNSKTIEVDGILATIKFEPEYDTFLKILNK